MLPVEEPANKYTSVFAEITKNVLGDDSCFNNTFTSEDDPTPKAHFRSFKPEASTYQAVASYKYEPQFDDYQKKY